MAIESASSSTLSSVAATYAAQQQSVQVNEQRNNENKQAEESRRQSDTVTLSGDVQRLRRNDQRGGVSASREVEDRSETSRQQQTEQVRTAQETRVASSRSYAQAIAAYRETSLV